MKEIGSEFWEFDNKEKNNNLEFLNLGKDSKLLMSGTTAIDYVLQDICDKNKIVYMPNYCCETMVKPFIDNGYKIKYYKVDLKNNKYYIDTNEECSIFFAMSYFGYEYSNMDVYIQKFKNRNIIVIEDITHRLLCQNNYCQESTYLVASLRKWFPIYTGGIAINVEKSFNVSIDNYNIDDILVSTKKKAMILKKEYMMGENEIDKNDFLELFKKANLMIENYKNKLIDDESIDILKNIDINRVIEKRRKNAQIIEKDLVTRKICVLYKLQEGDCPLFVPILLHNRDDIREKLIDNKIYCPVHWSNFNNFDNYIYNEELSLICDQRYAEDNIKEYIEKLVNIIERN